MLVMMLGELEYVDKIFPQKTEIVLKKNKTLASTTSNDLMEDMFDKDEYISTYYGESEDHKDFLQFAGKNKN